MQVGEKRSTVYAHLCRFCVEHMSTKHNKNAVKQKRDHFDDVNFGEHFVRIRVVFYKIRFVPP